MGLSAKDYIEVAVWTATGIETEYCLNGEAVALKLKGGTVADLRQHPPFLSMSPCPYCSCENNKGHDVLRHIDPFSGTPIGE
jgi:hypothetical protein